MRYSRSLVSLRTFGLAFAVALSPAFFQTTETFDCGGTGIAELTELTVEVWGMEQIAFDPTELLYKVPLPEVVEVAVVKAIPFESDAQVFMNYSTAVGAVGYMSGDVGGGESTIELARGESTLMVTVKTAGGAKMVYDVVFSVIDGG
jgi:hypothetical protein